MLHLAVYYDYKDVAKALIADGAKVNSKDTKDRLNRFLGYYQTGFHPPNPGFMFGVLGRTSLHLAISLMGNRESKDIVQLLIAKGADINAKDNSGRTPLNLAKNDDVKELLRKHGAKE